MTGPLAEYLATLYGRPGLALHGGTPVGKRRALVDDFQREDGPPFFVVSLEAGGTGLDLTEASHVIHFDRWWSPAVEDQATDRAFRIGQKRNVLVHTLVCRGTVEERIDALIEGKRALSRELLEGSGELTVFEMSDAELMRLVSLDLATALGEREDRVNGVGQLVRVPRTADGFFEEGEGREAPRRRGEEEDCLRPRADRGADDRPLVLG